MTTAASIVTYLKANWVDASYPITGGKDWTDNPQYSPWNLVQRADMDYPTTSNKKYVTFRVWAQNLVEAAIDALVTLLQAMDGSVVAVENIKCYRNGSYHEAIIDVVVSD